MIGQMLSADRGGRVAWAVGLAVLLGGGAWLLARPPGRGRAHVRPAESAAVALLAPRGIVASAPERFAWQPIAGAAEYKVQIADDDTVWPLFVRTSASHALLLGTDEARAFTPGRIYVWEVDARDGDGRPLATGRAHFRIAAPGAAVGGTPGAARATGTR